MSPWLGDRLSLTLIVRLVVAPYCRLDLYAAHKESHQPHPFFLGGSLRWLANQSLHGRGFTPDSSGSLPIGSFPSSKESAAFYIPDKFQQL